MAEIVVKHIFLLFIYILLIQTMRCLDLTSENCNSTLDPVSNTLQSLKQLNNTADIANVTNISSSNQTVSKSPCYCGGGLCACCSKILYDVWKQKVCVNVTYDPDEFSFTAKFMLNDRVIYTRTVSGKNPRPICVPLPRIPGVRTCMRFYNIYFQGRNVHACMNMEVRFFDTTLFKVGLDCIRLGVNGVAIVKPEDGTGLGQVEFLPETYDSNEETYDENEGDNEDNDSDYDDDY